MRGGSLPWEIPRASHILDQIAIECALRHTSHDFDVAFDVDLSQACYSFKS
ncbi:hypothetical protein L914_00019 [Phytophthora nicotianae]|uniref:Uncharacterized protein n=1 Tax=Phytophthora nicotianae TaxID=4792 RepID=W2P7Z0_PHYNI|nr:hypothetical protein L914_00019 [Phytophthora nicotianae]